MLQRSLLLLLLSILAACSGGTDITDITVVAPTATTAVAKVQTPLDAAIRSIEEAKAALSKVRAPADNVALVANLEAALLAIQDVVTKQQQVDSQLQLLAEKFMSLENERTTLQLAKTDLENRERLFSLGFYASFTTAIILIIGQLVRVPLILLDRKYRLLEIAEKEITIQEKKAKLNASTPPSET